MCKRVNYLKCKHSKWELTNKEDKNAVDTTQTGSMGKESSCQAYFKNI